MNLTYKVSIYALKVLKPDANGKVCPEALRGPLGNGRQAALGVVQVQGARGQPALRSEAVRQGKKKGRSLRHHVGAAGIGGKEKAVRAVAVEARAGVHRPVGRRRAEHTEAVRGHLGVRWPRSWGADGPRRLFGWYDAC